MSYIFEGILCYASVDNLRRAVIDEGSALTLHLVVSAFSTEVSVTNRNDSRDQADFTFKMDGVAEHLSITFGFALLVRYDDRIGHRSSAYIVDGRLQSSYGEEDEIWVLLDDNGEPLLSGPRFHTSELDPDPDVEYETIENAIQLGLKDFGAGDWEILHAAMTR